MKRRSKGKELIPDLGQTRDIRAEESGTNGTYISLAELLYDKYPVKFNECWNGLKTLAMDCGRKQRQGKVL